MREASMTPRQHHRAQQPTPRLSSPRDDHRREASPDEDSERSSTVGTPRRAKRLRTPGSKRGPASLRKSTTQRRRRFKPKQADYTGDAQLALIRACRGFKVRTGTEGVFFNDTNTPKAIAMECWREANVHYGLNYKQPATAVQSRSGRDRRLPPVTATGPWNTNYKIDENIIKIISDRGSQLRGAAKTAAEGPFAALYGFRDATCAEDIAYNQALVLKLQTKDGYTWITAPTPNTPGTGNGLYRHKLISRIIVDVFFSGHRDKRLAEIFPTPFNPIPLPTIALACTAIAACVDEYSTGQYVKREFKADLYKDVFERHMKRLNDFKKNRRDRLADIQIKLYELGSTHAGINADVAQVVDELTEADYAIDD
ncbi:hypothetical protein SISSUDRAFT_1067710 [Sistotremastrum suecicum HHB10207 ss-3]|uniref:DUF6532 domain-containing protein n=1 Tax=Sistotremastrum suecicum HHB10207 ss-3 TaxID=1314776 RepID=A0A165WT84_9AGAM|nr:hypothetical protein SISSUDRAFT_1067710 [Sistotremastrum suecicum HHB10207 ss-3]